MDKQVSNQMPNEHKTLDIDSRGTYLRFSRVVIGAMLLLVLILYGPIVLKQGVGGISLGGWGVLMGLAVGWMFGYLHGVGNALYLAASRDSTLARERNDR